MSFNWILLIPNQLVCATNAEKDKFFTRKNVIVQVFRDPVRNSKSSVSTLIPCFLRVRLILQVSKSPYSILPIVNIKQKAIQVSKLPYRPRGRRSRLRRRRPRSFLTWLNKY